MEKDPDFVINSWIMTVYNNESCKESIDSLNSKSYEEFVDIYNQFARWDEIKQAAQADADANAKVENINPYTKGL